MSSLYQSIDFDFTEILRCTCMTITQCVLELSRFTHRRHPANEALQKSSGAWKNPQRYFEFVRQTNDRARVYVQRYYPLRSGWWSPHYALTFIDVCMHKEYWLARPPLAISFALVSVLLSVCSARKANGELGFESPKLHANAFGWTEISVGNESGINVRGYTKKSLEL